MKKYVYCLATVAALLSMTQGMADDNGQTKPKTEVMPEPTPENPNPVMPQPAPGEVIAQ